MKRQMISVFLTSLLMIGCVDSPTQCTTNIGVGRTAIVTAEDGSQYQVTSDVDGNVTYDCGATVATV